MNKILGFIEKYQSYFFFLVAVILSIISARGFYFLDPRGIISLGDFFELPNYQDVARYNYAVFDHIGTGMGNPLVLANWYYVFLDWFYSFDTIFHHRHFYYIVSYYIATYLLIYLAIRIFIRNPNYTQYSIVLLFVFNPLTLTFFRYSWGFTHYSLHYIGISVMVVTYILLLVNLDNNRSKAILGGIYSAVILLFTTTNIAFLALAGIIMLLIGLLYFSFLGKLKNGITSYFLYGVILGIAVISIAYYMYLIQGEFKETIKYNVAFGGDAMSFIRAYSSSILDTLFFNLNGYNSSFIIYGSVPIIVLFVLRILGYGRNLGYIYIPLLFLIALSVRINDPFLVLNTYIYDSFIGSFIRSADKVFFVYVTLFCVLLFLIFGEIKGRLKLFSAGIIISFIFILVFDYPYQRNDIQDYKDTDMLVSIPDEYYYLQSILGPNDRVIALPYNAMISPAWSDHVTWHQRGNTILSELTLAEWVSANVEDHPGSGGDFRFKECPVINEKFSQEMQYLRGTYIIIHTDIDAIFISCADNIIYGLLDDPKYTLVEENMFYTLFKINHQYSNAIQKTNPTQHRILSLVPTTEFEHPYTYSKYWKIVDDNSAKIEMINNFSTKFTITTPKLFIDVEYFPQKILENLYILRYAYLALLIFTITALSYIGFFTIKSHNKTEY